MSAVQVLWRSIVVWTFIHVNSELPLRRVRHKCSFASRPLDLILLHENDNAPITRRRTGCGICPLSSRVPELVDITPAVPLSNKAHRSALKEFPCGTEDSACDAGRGLPVLA